MLQHLGQLSDFDRATDSPASTGTASTRRAITLGTGHPQGGNALSRQPGRGVVDPDFRVHGFANLYVCDASVFPTSIKVNPQLTVMSLAHYAAERIANGAPPARQRAKESDA